MAIPQRTPAAQLAQMHFAYNPETGKSKFRRSSDGNVFEVDAVTFKNAQGWEAVDRNTKSVGERLEEMSHAQLCDLRQQNGQLNDIAAVSHADLVRTITELVRREEITMPEAA